MLRPHGLPLVESDRAGLGVEREEPDARGGRLPGNGKSVAFGGEVERHGVCRRLRQLVRKSGGGLRLRVEWNSPDGPLCLAGRADVEGVT